MWFLCLFLSLRDGILCPDPNPVSPLNVLKAEAFSIEHPNPEGSPVLREPGALPVRALTPVHPLAAQGQLPALLLLLEQEQGQGGPFMFKQIQCLGKGK